MTLGSRAAEKFFKKKGGKTGTRENQLWTLVKKYYDIGLEARRPFEQRWCICLAFLGGRQYTFFNTNTHSLQSLRRVKGRVRKVDNQLLPRWRRQVSDLIRSNPEMSVVPNTNEDEDIKAAKIGDKYLKSFWRTNEMKRKIRQLGGWIHSTGNCFVDDRWNRRLGPTEIDPKTGELVYGGDVDCGIWSPFEVIVPFSVLGDTELHDFPWLIKAKWRSLDWIKKYYPKEGVRVVGEQMPTPVVDTTIVTGLKSATVTGKLPGALVMDFYLQPSIDFPKGIFISAANTVILQEDTYPFNEYSLEHFKDIDIPGVFWGKATLEAGIPLQKSWNSTISDMQEFNRVMGNGKWLSPRGSKVEVRPDDTHGQIIDYKPVMGHKPEMLTLKGLPSTYDKTLMVVTNSLNNLFSQHEVTQGTNRPDLRSGEMAEFLREQDAHGAIPTHAILEEGLERVSSRVLKRAQKGYTDQRMIKVVGREGEFEVVAFKGSDLRSNTDVTVKKQSSLPDSRLARENQILRRYEVGLYGPPDDPEVRRHVMNMLDDAVVKDIYSDTRLDEAVARWENQIFLSQEAEVYMINNFDDHGLHLREHGHFLKSMDYQKLKLQDPKRFMAVGIRFMKHMEMHQAFVAEQQEAAMRQQAQFEAMKKEAGR